MVSMKQLRFLWPLIFVLGTSIVLAETWELAKQDTQRDIRVYVQEYSNSPYKGFYATTHTNAKLSTIVAVLSDVQAMPEWIVRLRSSKLLKRQAATDVWIHNIYVLPYPFQDREAVLHSTLKQENSGVVVIQSHAVKGMMPINKDRVRLHDMQSTWRLTPENGQVKIELWGRGHPGGYLPPMLFNYNLPSGPAQTLKFLRQMLTRDKYKNKKLSYIREPS
jgi:hypothetical protein